MPDLLSWGSGYKRKVKDPIARAKYWNDKARAFLITNKDCEKCDGKLEWIGVQTFGVNKYACTKCYEKFNIRSDK